MKSEESGLFRKEKLSFQTKLTLLNDVTKKIHQLLKREMITNEPSNTIEQLLRAPKSIHWIRGNVIMVRK